MENKETTIVENNSEVISQPIKKKSNKKVIILAAVIAVVVIGIVAAVIAIVVGNSNSLWLPPLENDNKYGYSVMPEEFIEKVNGIDLGCEYKYYQTTTSENNPDIDRYSYTLSNLKENFAFGFLDYYPDNTIRSIGVVIPSSSATFKGACGNMGEIAAQILYAYDAFGKNASEDDVIDASDIFEIAFGKSDSDKANIFKYNDFLFTIKMNFNFDTKPISDSALLIVEKTDENHINELEQNGANVIDLAAED